MKTILLFLVIIASCFVCRAQQVKLTKVDTVTTVKDYEMEFVRECLWQYQKQHQVAYTMTFLGAGSMVVGATMSADNNNNKVFYVAGGMCLVWGMVSMIASEKWLRKAAVRPVPGG